VFAIRDLFLIHAIDYDAPVLAIQKQLASLRRGASGRESGSRWRAV